MIDQATELRKLVLRAMREQPITLGPPPRLIALTGGKGGVGVTTIAVNLSVALAEQGSRVVVVDANPHRSDVATLCGVSDFKYEPDVASSRCDIHEVLHPGPAGIQIVPGLRVPAVNEQESTGLDLNVPNPNGHGIGEISYERLQRQLSTLGRHADVVVLDLGGGSDELIRRFSTTADELLLVTTPDNIAVMDAYSRIKTDLALASDNSLMLVVNQTAHESHAADVHRRIDGSCRRFLDTTIQFAGHVPQDEVVTRAAACRLPFVLGVPTATASQAIDQLASRLVPTSTTLRSV